MSKITFVTFLITIALNILSLHAKEKVDFVNGIDDLPLFSEMSNSDESLVVFDTNHGRVVISEIFGEVEKSKARNFYYEILPNLGWKALDKNQFTRDGELMQIEFLNNNNQLYIKFKLVPN